MTYIYNKKYVELKQLCGLEYLDSQRLQLTNAKSGGRWTHDVTKCHSDDIPVSKLSKTITLILSYLIYKTTADDS